ncbi:hypothetical protein GCM10022626_00370 [[Pseudomonas] carboxydohydrogena]
MVPAIPGARLRPGENLKPFSADESAAILGLWPRTFGEGAWFHPDRPNRARFTDTEALIR